MLESVLENARVLRDGLERLGYAVVAPQVLPAGAALQLGAPGVRAPQGGHALILRPEEVRLSDVIRSLEGSLSPVAHLHDEGYQCRAAHEVWHNVEEATQKILDSVTIGN